MYNFKAKSASLILEFVTSVKIPQRTGKFVVADELSAGDYNGLKILSWSHIFKIYFGDKVEDSMQASEISVHRIIKRAFDIDVLEELGGEASAGMTLSKLHTLLLIQGMGQKGIFLTNGGTNIAYIHDKEGTLRSVCFAWNNGWNFSAFPISVASRWDSDVLVASFKSIIN